MHVLSRPALREFGKRHPGAKEWLDNWWRTAAKPKWEKLEQVRRTYPATDQFKKCLIFDKGNDYRLIVRVSYKNKHARHALREMFFDSR